MEHKIILQSKRDRTRTIELTPIEWGQMIEIGKHKEWKVINPESVKEMEESDKKVEKSVADYIASKKIIKTKEPKTK